MADTVNMPKLGFDMAEGTLVRWVVQEGEKIDKGNVLAEIETDKATVEVESPFAGVVARHLVKQGDIVPVNTPIAVIAAPGEDIPVEAPQPGATETPPPAEKGKTESGAAIAAEAEVKSAPAGADMISAAVDLPGGVKASPLARRLAQERNIDLAGVRGSGPGGRITRKDIENYRPAPAAATAVTAQPAAVSPQAVMESVAIPVNRLRAAIGRRMTESKQNLPHFYVTHEYDMAAVMELRKQVNVLLPENEKTSVNDFILKAAALGLREFPNLNASLDGAQIIRHGAVNMGVAVAVDGGLLTVVCRDTDQKSIRKISSEIRSMAQRARDGKVRPDDIEGSTFSVSNLGMFDVEHFIAIINPPEAAILAVGSVREVPVVKDGQVVSGMRMKATISVDHRVSDGAEAARYLQALAKYLEEPLRLMV
jgi:pyruvate dehydrogenase E2 component (dihydrolipoamide acetyltransferase)